MHDRCKCYVKGLVIPMFCVDISLCNILTVKKTIIFQIWKWRFDILRTLEVAFPPTLSDIYNVRIWQSAHNKKGDEQPRSSH